MREHELPIWQVDFADDEATAAIMCPARPASCSSAATTAGAGGTSSGCSTTWIMPNRTSFNHPLIITVGFAMAWLAVTGFWLLFRTMWRHDFVGLRRFKS